MNSLRLFACGGLAALSLTACSPASSDAPAAQPAQPQGTAQLKPEYDDSGKLQKLEYDRDKDGKVDRWEFHRADAASGAGGGAAPGVDKTVERIERATKFDGTVSRREFFDNGVLTKIEEDTDGNGSVDKWETYTDGSLSVMALDTAGRGTPDRRLVYRPDGSMDHIEADPNGTGTFTRLNP